LQIEKVLMKTHGNNTILRGENKNVMAKFKSTGKLTLANDGSLIYVPTTDRERFFMEKFGLKAEKTLAFKKKPRKLETGSEPDDKSAADVIELDNGSDDPGANKWTPKEEDLIRVPFRALSATIVAGGTWRTTDFTDESMLRRSLNKIVGKSAFTEHWQYTSNCIGAVESSKWSEMRFMDGGKKVPAGIDVVYLINAKLNEDLASNLLMTPPGIYSNSVTVEFEWEPSHDDFADEDGFMRSIGQVHADGRMVARKVTDIIDYHESSILWLGADPFAKMLDKDGNPINPEFGAAFDQVQGFAKEMYESSKHYCASYSYKKEGIVLKSEIENTPVMEKLLLEFARKILGLAADAEVTQAHIDQLKALKFIGADEHTKMTGSLTKVTELEKEVGELRTKGTDAQLKKQNDDFIIEVAGLKKDKGDLELKVTELEPFATIGKTNLEAKRAETIRLYKLTLEEGQKEDAVMLETFGKADDKQLNGFLAMFTKGVAEKFEATCSTCGKTEVSFRSTFAEGEHGDPNKGGKVQSERYGVRRLNG
jgi:hypothetical protein